jgi:membrane-bound lytic murein transglycosylase B
MTMSLSRRALRCLVAALAFGATTALAQPPNGNNNGNNNGNKNGSSGEPYGQRDDVMRFADEVAQRQPQLDAAWLRTQLQRARKVETVRKLIMPPPVVDGKATVKNWAAYRTRFLDRERIGAGAAFWRANDTWLQRAEQRWGVPAQVIVGVIGVETFYGRLTGSFRVIDALATLSFDFPTGRRDRTPFFRGELEQFLVWCARERCDPAQVRGSFAGAMGLPQFMPGSVNRWAVDFDGDGHIDLATSAPDAIGSVAHYLHYFGWQRGAPTHFDVRAPDNTADRALLLGPDILPLFSAEEFALRGATLPAEGRAHDGPLALVELHNGEAAAPSHVAGTRNFWAVTRYNWSSYYALAVIDLGAAVAQRMGMR